MCQMRLQYILLQLNLGIGMNVLHITATTYPKMRTDGLDTHIKRCTQQFYTVGFFQLFDFTANTGTHGFTRQRIADKHFLAVFFRRMIGMGAIVSYATPFMGKRLNLKNILGWLLETGSSAMFHENLICGEWKIKTGKCSLLRSFAPAA